MKQQKQSKTPLMLRLDETLHKKVVYVSSEERRSLNSQIEHFIHKGIEEFERIHGTIQIDDES